MTDKDLVAPWLEAIKGVCTAYGEDPAIVAAIADRESGFAHGAGYTPPGDPWGLHADKHGHGLFGIDDRWWSGWIRKSDHSAVDQVKFLAGLFRKNREYLRTVAVSIPESDRLRALIAAWNCGPYHVKQAILNGKDIDIYTTGSDYSAWVIKRADQLRPVVGI